MEKQHRAVAAVCSTTEETIETVNRLTAEGYSRKDITVYANKGTTDTFQSMDDVRVEKEGLWNKVKDTFQSSKTHEPDVLDDYREDIRSGKYIIVVEGWRGEPAAAAHPEASVPETNEPEVHVPDQPDDDTIRLKEEQLDVDKREVATGDVEVTKNVVQEVRTIEVPVEKEELVIEKRSFTDGDEEPETIRIPIKEEQIEVTKKPVVKEEVSVHKEVTQEMKQVSGDVKKERLDVDTHGEAQVRENHPDEGINR